MKFFKTFSIIQLVLFFYNSTTILSQQPNSNLSSITIPLSQPTPGPPTPSQQVINGVTVRIPQLCSNNQEFSSCSSKSSNAMSSCQSLVVETPNATFYSCLCGGMESLLGCFSLCPDDPQLTSQKTIYEQQFRSQCITYKKNILDVAIQQELEARNKSGSEATNNNNNALKPNKSMDVPPATIASSPTSDSTKGNDTTKYRDLISPSIFENEDIRLSIHNGLVCCVFTFVAILFYLSI